MNNRIYGMTGGQFSPLSGEGVLCTTAPQLTIDRSFDTVELALASGASFVARTTAFHVREITKLISKAIQHKGFSVVEILSQCPTHFGRKNKLGDASNMLEFFKKNTTPIGSKAKQDNPDLIERGIFRELDIPDYCADYERTIHKAQKGKTS
jgi:2-oxoglutarate ferredoxin oxidoreductase subunit beta